MEKNDRNRTIALAAALMAADSVRQLAYTGEADPTNTRTLIDSLFVIEATNIGDIYADPQHLRRGFQVMRGTLTQPSQMPETMDVTRYIVSLFHLEKLLRRRPEVGEQLISGLTDVRRQIEFFGDTMHESVIAKLGDLYQQIISPLGSRIIVRGEQRYLTSTNTAALIRALLLTGIRAAVLWRQADGSRFKLLFRRRQMLAEAQALVNSAV
ncbi:MAG: high frequency lysogenization protein HflD [Thiotrichales bacterium]